MNEVGLEVNTEKNKYVSKIRYQLAGQKHSIKTANRSFGDVAEFKYLGTTFNRSKLHARKD
jgi:hypothetical protein